MKEQYIMERQEESLAAKAQRRIRLYRIATAVICLIVAGTAIWFYITSVVASKSVLREAKSVRMAMKMLAIEHYSSGTSIFDPKQKDGLIEGGAERLKILSEADGKVVLTGWNKAESDPLSFTYTKGNYVVVFNRYGADEETKDEADNGDIKNEEFAEDSGLWEVYLQMRVSRYGG